MEEYQSMGVQEKYLSKLQTQRTPSTIYTINPLLENLFLIWRRRGRVSADSYNL